MKLTAVTTAVLLLSTGYALAGPGSGEPNAPANPASGRPSAVLDDAQCADVWNSTNRGSDTLSEGQAGPFVVNFGMVDANDDGQISEAEFKEGCQKGWVQQAEAPQQPSGEAVPETSEPMQQDTVPEVEQPSGDTGSEPLPQ